MEERKEGQFDKLKTLLSLYLRVCWGIMYRAKKHTFMHSTKKRQLAAILFADIVGYTALMQQNEVLAKSQLDKFRLVLEEQVAAHKGKIVHFYGDGCLAIFNAPLQAVQCAAKIQLDFRKAPPVPVRVGLHSGTVAIDGESVYGNAVNLASRIESMGIPGAVLLSQRIQGDLKNQPSVKTIALGKFDFKNVEQAMEVFALEGEKLIVPKRSELKGKFKKKPAPIANRGMLAFILFMAAFGLWSLFQANKLWSNENSSSSQEKTIAVLPLTNLNREEENFDYFSKGLSQEIISELAKIKSIRVSSFTQSSFYNSMKMPSDKIAKELKVNYLISGTSRILNNPERIILSIELLNPFTKERLWSGTFEEEMENAYAIQMAIAKEIASNLHIKLSPTEVAALDKPVTISGETFKLFLRAKAEFAKMTPQALKRCQALLRKAIELDENYAEAYTFLAWSYLISGDPMGNAQAISGSQTKALVEPLIAKSMALDSQNSEAYIIRAGSNLFYGAQIKDALKDIEYALALKSWSEIPTDHCICVAISVYGATGKMSKAESMVSLAKEVDPGNPLIFWDQGNIAMIKGNYEEAQNLYQQTVDKVDVQIFNAFLGWSYYHGKKYKKALKVLLRMHNMEGVRPVAFNTAFVSNAYYMLGDNESSDRYLKELLDRDKKGEHHVNFYLSMIYSARKNIPKALDYFELAFKKQEYNFILMTGIDPIFKILHNEPRYIEIRRKMQAFE